MTKKQTREHKFGNQIRKAAILAACRTDKHLIPILGSKVQNGKYTKMATDAMANLAKLNK